MTGGGTLPIVGGRKRVTVPAPGETVVWEGRSLRGVTITAFEGPLVAYGLMATVIGFGLVIHHRWLGGVPLLAIGIYLMIGQFIFETKRRRHADYILTLDHAYIVHSWPWAHVVTVDLRRVGPSFLTIHKDGTGTITFGRVPDALAWWTPLRLAHPAFRYIDVAPDLMPIIRGEATEIRRLPPSQHEN